jgi:hydrogenase maturation protease
MRPGVIVFAVGNRSRGDDALGPLLLERLALWLAAEGRIGDFELIDGYQLQIEDALDLGNRRLALFIDAGRGTTAPFEFRAVRAATASGGGGTHALPPERVLQVFREIGQGEPPPSFVLCIRGERFELGEGLSAAAARNAEAAWTLLARLCGAPDPGVWRALADEARTPAAAATGVAAIRSPISG